MQVDYDTYKSMDFTCNKCGWQGNGKALSNGGFSEASFIGDLDCPKCFELVAFWQAPYHEKDENNNLEAPLIDKAENNNKPLKFHLRVYDNFHYMDEEEAYNHGQFETYEEAMLAAKAIVEEFFVNTWEMGKTAGDLLAEYSMFGEDPVILPNEHGEHPSFSAWTYADEIHETICKKLQA